MSVSFNKAPLGLTLSHVTPTGATHSNAFHTVASCHVNNKRVNNNVTVTITVQDAATAPVVGAVVGIYNANTNVELENNETDGSGIVTFSTSASQPVYVRVLKSTTGSTRYVPVETTGNTGSGLNLTVTLNEDGIVDP